jgi:hypothetical protein
MALNEKLTGACLCGSVTYEVRQPHLQFAHCCCTRCRKATGASHATNLYVAPAQFSWTAGEALTKRYDLPTAASFSTSVCTRCGGPVPRHTRNRTKIVVPAGTLDDVPDLEPQANIFWASRAPWSCGDSGLPCHDEYTPDWR